MARPIRVALVAPTLSILGGHSVQAVRLLNGWRDDPEVQLRLVPINPPSPRALVWLTRIKYVRTLVTQLCYWPRLVRELRRADVVHVFSASSSSFYLAPLPAIAVSRLCGKPLIVNYRSGDAQEHLGGSAVARRALRSADLNVVPSSFLCVRWLRYPRAGHCQCRRARSVPLPCAKPAAAPAPVHPQPRSDLQRRLRDSRIRARAGS